MPTGPLDWDFSLELRSQALQQFNPLPLLLHNLMEIPNLQPHSGKLYTLLAELFSNALEHGVLGLDSGLKATPSGFADYYQLRKRKLADLTEGWVKFHFTHQLTDEGGELLIQVQDSGPGFDFKTALQAGQNAIKTNQKSGYCGRGLTLIKSLCHSLTHQGNGNQVECVFTWQTAS
jgi:anti-sigma regulatory factor (Ser/Thr protein kinase)